jgi:hypothetical protein
MLKSMGRPTTKLRDLAVRSQPPGRRVLSRDNLASKLMHRRVWSISIRTCHGTPWSGGAIVQGCLPKATATSLVLIMVCFEGELIYAACTNWASIEAWPLSVRWSQRATGLTRLGYHIATDPHLVRRVIGGSLCSIKSPLHCRASTLLRSAYYHSVTLYSTLHTSRTTSRQLPVFLPTPLSGSSRVHIHLILYTYSSVDCTDPL